MQTNSPRQLAKVEKNHNARVVFLKIMMSGLILEVDINKYLVLMNDTQTPRPDNDLQSAVRECMVHAANISKNLESSVRPELTSMIEDEDFPQNVRQDILEFWALCGDLQLCVSEPKGDLRSYRERSIDIRSRFDHLASSLRVALGASD